MSGRGQCEDNKVVDVGDSIDTNDDDDSVRYLGLTMRREDGSWLTGDADADGSVNVGDADDVDGRCEAVGSGWSARSVSETSVCDAIMLTSVTTR